MDSFIARVRLVHHTDITKPSLLLLDEIQVWQDTERFIKMLYDAERVQAHIIITGSRFWGQKAMGSSMVGRGKTLHVQGFSLSEYLLYQGYQVSSLDDIQYKWIEESLQEYLSRGGYPAVVKAKTGKQKKEELERILTSWVEKDFTLFFEGEYRGVFLQLFDYCVQNTGNVLSFDKLSSRLGISKYYIQRFYQFLIDSYMIHEVSPFFQDKTKELSKKREYFIHDLGLSRIRQGSRLYETHNGKINETYVYHQLYTQYANDIFFYEKKAGSEIDFVIRTRKNTLIPIEVKSSDKCKVPKVFKSFFEIYGQHISFAIVTTQSIQKTIVYNEKKIYFIPFWAVSTHLQKLEKIADNT